MALDVALDPIRRVKDNPIVVFPVRNNQRVVGGFSPSATVIWIGYDMGALLRVLGFVR
jgi:hypothetical protein